jgi:hypothetical protein
MVVEPGTEALELIKKKFGPNFVSEDGSLDRKALGSLVFSDSLKRSELEAILHPRIHELFLSELEKASLAGAKMIVYEVPLLFESGKSWPEMSQGSPHIDQLATQTETFQGVCFDPDNVVLEGIYSDEISAHRAKRRWVTTLEGCFLLDKGLDYEISVASNTEIRSFRLSCRFISACARYAFWRLTNSQAPEAQYIIETAHIPECESRIMDFASAPDMTHISQLEANLEQHFGNVESVGTILKRILNKLIKS